MEANEWKYLITKATTAQKVSQKLAEQSSKFAEFISSKMDDLGLSTLTTEDKYTITVFNRSASCGDYDVMFANYDCYGRNGDLLSPKISTSGHYVWGDINHWIDYPTNKDVLKFIHNAESILKAINKKIIEMEAIVVPET